MPATGRQQIIAAKRRAQVLELRLAGLTYDQIADHLNITPQAAYMDVERVLTQTLMERTRNVDLLIEEQLAVLVRMRGAAWRNAVKGDVRSIDTVLKITDRICKLLRLDPGFDINIEVSSVDAIERQIAQLNKQIALEATQYDWEDQPGGIPSFEA